jgi:hypothetical protein
MQYYWRVANCPIGVLARVLDGIPPGVYHVRRSELSISPNKVKSWETGMITRLLSSTVLLLVYHMLLFSS